jgi:hypothetical protein
VKESRSGYSCDRKAFSRGTSEQGVVREIYYSLSRTINYFAGGVEWYEFEGEKCLIMDLCEHFSLAHYLASL